MAGDSGLHGDSVAWFKSCYGWVDRDDLLVREEGWRTGECGGRRMEQGWTNLACGFVP